MTTGSYFHYPGYAVFASCIIFCFKQNIPIIEWFAETSLLVAMTGAFYYYLTFQHIHNNPTPYGFLLFAADLFKVPC
jgi:hypothetical protein